MPKRTTITNGIRLWRYPVGLFALFSLISFLQNNHWNSTSIISLFIPCIAFTLIYYSRRIVFSQNHFYKIYGHKEIIIPFKSIQSIKRSAVKINGTRMWKVTYRKRNGFKKKMMFLEGIFQSGSTKTLIKRVKSVNPNMVIWEHPHFNHR